MFLYFLSTETPFAFIGSLPKNTLYAILPLSDVTALNGSDQDANWITQLNTRMCTILRFPSVFQTPDRNGVFSFLQAIRHHNY